MQLHPQYYYQQLPPPERAAYHGMLTCLRELAPSARIPRLTMETLGTLFFQLRLDHPEIFYAVGFRAALCPRRSSWTFVPSIALKKSASVSTGRQLRRARRGYCVRCAACHRRSRSARSMISLWKTFATISLKNRIRTRSSAR